MVSLFSRPSPLTPLPGTLLYSEADLAWWYERLVDVRKVPGIAWTNLNEASNRIEISIYPLRGAREEWEAALATLDVQRSHCHRGWM